MKDYMKNKKDFELYSVEDKNKNMVDTNSSNTSKNTYTNFFRNLIDLEKQKLKKNYNVSTNMEGVNFLLNTTKNTNPNTFKYTSNKTFNQNILQDKLSLPIIKNLSQKYSVTIQNSLSKKYFVSVQSYNNNIINNLLLNKNCHVSSLFKDYMILDFIDEFLKREYKLGESLERIPKFANYYKNYLKFFCNPSFRDTKVNCIIQIYGDNKAELYYNRNYGLKKKQKKELLNKNEKSEKEKLSNTIFNTTIKNNIERNSLTITQNTIRTDISGLLENSFNSLENMIKEESILRILDNLQSERNENYMIDDYDINKKLNSAGKSNRSLSNRLNKKFSSLIPKQIEEKIIKEFEMKVMPKFEEESDKKIDNLKLVKNFNFISPKSNLKNEKINIPENLNLGIKNHNYYTVEKIRNSTPKVIVSTNHHTSENNSNNNAFINNYFTQNNLNINKERLKSSLGGKVAKSSPKFSTKNKLNDVKNNIHKQISNNNIKSKSNMNNNIQHSQSPSIGQLNDIMKITLSLYMDKSSRNHPNLNQALTGTTGNNININSNTATTIINKVGNINNFNININNLNNDNFEYLLAGNNLNSNLDENINNNTANNNRITLTKNLQNLIEKNKNLSRNKPNALYKVPSNGNPQFKSSKTEEEENLIMSAGNIKMKNNKQPAFNFLHKSSHICPDSIKKIADMKLFNSSKNTNFKNPKITSTNINFNIKNLKNLKINTNSLNNYNTLGTMNEYSHKKTLSNSKSPLKFLQSDLPQRNSFNKNIILNTVGKNNFTNSTNMHMNTHLNINSNSLMNNYNNVGYSNLNTISHSNLNIEKKRIKVQSTRSTGEAKKLIIGNNLNNFKNSSNLNSLGNNLTNSIKSTTNKILNLYQTVGNINKKYPISGNKK